MKKKGITIKGIKELKDRIIQGSTKIRVEAEIDYFSKHPEKLDLATKTTMVLEFAELMKEPQSFPSTSSIKKLISTIMSDGRFKDLDFDAFKQFIDSLYMTRLFSDADDFSQYICSLRQHELKQMKKEFESAQDTSDSEQKSKELQMLFELMYQASVFTTSEDNSRDTIIWILKEKYGIDLKKGINTNQVPHFVYDSIVSIISKYMLQSTSSKDWDEIIDNNLGIIKNRIDVLISSNSSGKPEEILLEEPLILELYNLANCEVEIDGNIAPSNENREKIKQILSLLPTPKMVSPDEKKYVYACYYKYKKSPMPKSDWDRFINIYLRKLMSLVVSGEYEDKNLFLFSDTILGQLAMDNPIARPDIDENLLNLYKIALRDYANGVLKFKVPFRKTRLNMLENRAIPEMRGGFSPEYKVIYLKSRVENMEDLCDNINTIAHELQHAQTDLNFSINSPTTLTEYVAIKLTTMMKSIPNLVNIGGFNYLDSAHEIMARLAGYSWVLEFMKEHGVDIESDEAAKNRLRFLATDQIRKRRATLLRNPKYYKRTTIYELNKQKRERLIAKIIGEYKEVVFKSKEYQDYVKDVLNPEKEKIEDLLKEEKIFDDEKEALLDIHRIFDRYIKEHRELCSPGSYFSIEYNPNGERKTIREVLKDMKSLDKSDSYDSRREFYKYLIEACIIPNTRAYEALDALIEYKQANSKDGQIVAEIVDENIEPLLERIKNEAQPMASRREMDTLVDRIVRGVKENDEKVEKSRQTSSQSKVEYTPFVKGVSYHYKTFREKPVKKSLFTKEDIGRRFFGKILSKCGENKLKKIEMESNSRE